MALTLSMYTFTMTLNIPFRGTSRLSKNSQYFMQLYAININMISNMITK